jgi:polysaccharide pyruvyl transferase WcaK-like protein
MAVRIDGYFDRNFGDDYMIKTVTEHFAGVRFVIKDTEGVPEMLRRLDNVIISDEETEKKLRVIGSGFMINSPGAFITELVWLLKGRKEPGWCIGCNIEPFNNFISGWIIKKKLQKYSLITTRDKKSYEWLKKNCKKVWVEYFPDIVFAADIKKPSQKGDKLGISVMNLGFREKYESYYNSLAQAADYYIETTGKGVLLLAFDSGKENDMEACSYVQSLMKRKEAQIVVHGSENEIINAYSECGKIIGTRFHSAVLALKMGIDLYPVIYRHKMSNLLADIGFGGKRSSVEKPDLKGMKDFLEEGYGYTLPVEYADKAKGHFDILKELL